MEISEGFELIPNQDGAYDARITLDPRGTVINVPEEYDGKVIYRILLQRGFFNFDFIKIEPSVVFIPKTVKTVRNNSQDGSNIPFFAKISRIIHTSAPMKKPFSQRTDRRYTCSRHTVIKAM